MRIIQLTDIHLGLEGEDTKGVHTRKNFLDAMNAINTFNPDLLLITGDICYKTPYQEIYDWVEKKLNELPYEVLIIGGNHDDINMIPHQFLPAQGDENSERYFVEHLPEIGTSLFFLDTHAGIMEEKQLAFLQKRLPASQKRVIIFMHHPPFYAGVPYMDNNHAFQSMEEFENVLEKSRVKPIIFSGHYHVEKTISRNGICAHITPSTFFQIKHDQTDFGVDHYNIGFRVIDLDTSVMLHRVEYLPGNLLSNESIT